MWVADAERYDRWFDSPWGTYAFATERQAILAAAGTLTGMTVADIGCGTGRFTTHLDRRAGRVVGLDRDPAMLAVAARRTRAPLVVGDGHRLPFADHRFDLTVAITVCEFAADPAAAISELARITPTGRACRRRRPPPAQSMGHRQPSPVRPTPPGIPPSSSAEPTCTDLGNHTAP